MSTNIDKNLLLCTLGVGKNISVAPALENEFKLLKSAAKTSYYPKMALKHLEALNTGLSGKHNVFISNTNDFKANTFQKVVVFVPGIRATVERRSNDTLVITELWLDPNKSYESISKTGINRPGVYEASIGSWGVEIKYKTNGRIKAKDYRKVVVADTRHAGPLSAAKAAYADLESMFGGAAALVGEFDLFYSPVGSQLGGMLNYNPIIQNQAYFFGGLLADAIEQSIKQKGVEWTSDLGGSVVLTQSLHALAYKNISFADQKHVVKMYMPTTDPSPIIEDANKLGMLVDKNIAMGNGNMRASISSLLTNANRVCHKSDPYSFEDYLNQLSDRSMGVFGAAGAISFGAGLLISSPVLTTAGTVASAAGVIQFAVKAVKKRLKKGF